MRGRGKSFGAVTIVSAIASGRGCALGIDLPIEVEIELEEGTLQKDSFADYCIKEVFNHFSVSYKPNIKINSKIPVARGLKSSSALANATILATLDALGKTLTEEEILKMNVNASRISGVSITGALDDAAACLRGGLVFTDNKSDRILKKEKFHENVKCVLHIPEEESHTRNLLPKMEGIRKYSSIVDTIFWLANEGNVFEAMTLNGFLYCNVLGFSTERIKGAIRAGAMAASLSGTGSAFAALVFKENLEDVVSCWNGIVTDVRKG